MRDSNYVPFSQVSFETEEDQEKLRCSYPGRERDLMYGWVKEGTEGAKGMPLNVQVREFDKYKLPVFNFFGNFDRCLSHIYLFQLSLKGLI